jgi:hypothetical protein
VAVAWPSQPGTATALAHPVGVVVRLGRNHCVEWEAGAMAQLLRCVGGCGQPGLWRERLEGSCSRPGPWRGVARPAGARLTAAAIGRWQNQVQKC